MDQNATPQPVGTPEPQKSSQEQSQQQQQTPPIKTWHDSFTDSDLKEDVSIKKYKTLDDFGKAFKEKDALIGRKGVILPKENDEKDTERFYNQLGRPEQPELYKVPEIKTEEEFKQFITTDKLNSFKTIAHKYGLTQKQFEGITKDFTESQLSEIKSIVYSENKKREESAKQLMNEWMLDYDANSRRSEETIKAFSKGVPNEKLEVLLQDADVKRMFFNVSKMISEDTLKVGTRAGTDTVQSLQSFIDSQVKTKGSSYWDPDAADYNEVHEKVHEAYRKKALLLKGVE